jgi:predicted Zn-dependent protease
VTRALELAEAALAAVPGEDAEAVVQSEYSGFARFARSEVHQPTLVDNHTISLRIQRGGRVGGASTNRAGAEALADLARRAQDAVAMAPEDPDFSGFAPSAPAPAVDGYDEATASLEPAEQAQLAQQAIAAARPFELFGYVTSGVVELAVATSAGLAVEQRMTDASVLALAATDGASGYAERQSSAATELGPDEAAEEAARKADATRGGGELPPGDYRAVLEPYAFAELLEYFAWDSFGGLGLLEESSYLAGRLGKRIFASSVSIAEDPLDPAGLPKAIDFEGTPRRRVPLVENGVARGVVWDRITAARAGEESTGNAVPVESRRYGPMPVALSVAGGEAGSIEALEQTVGEGIYVTRLHYLSVVSPREGIVTGMTRDGTFRIQGGKRAEPLGNLRFTVSVPDMLAEVAALGREPMLVNRTQWYGDRYAYGYRVPPIATGRFTITGNGSGPGL